MCTSDPLPDHKQQHVGSCMHHCRAHVAEAVQVPPNSIPALAARGGCGVPLYCSVHVSSCTISGAVWMHQAHRPPYRRHCNKALLHSALPSNSIPVLAPRMRLHVVDAYCVCISAVAFLPQMTCGRNVLYCAVLCCAVLS